MSALGNSFSELIRSVLRNPAAAKTYAMDNHAVGWGKSIDGTEGKMPGLNNGADDGDLWNSTSAAVPNAGRDGTGAEQSMRGGWAPHMADEFGADSGGDGITAMYRAFNALLERQASTEKAVHSMAALLNTMVKAMSADGDGATDEEKEKKKDDDDAEDEAAEKAAKSSGEIVLDTNLKGFFDSIRGLRSAATRASRVATPPSFLSKSTPTDDAEDAMDSMSMVDRINYSTLLVRQRAAREGLMDPRNVTLGLGPTPVTGALHRQVIAGTDRPN